MIQWELLRLSDKEESDVIELQRAFKERGSNINPLFLRLLVQRGVVTFEQARQYFRPSLDDLHDPFLMKGMKKAVERIHQALEAGEKIMIYGDYDVDGVTSIAMVKLFFEEILHIDVLCYIPCRHEEGYGLSKKGIDKAKEEGISLIITFDCGINAVDKSKYAGELGIDMVISDHHKPGYKTPKVFSIINPKQTDCPYPYKELCGCGIAFKLMQGICHQLDLSPEIYHRYLDFVAVATASDIVPLTGENRVLAYYGLKLLDKKTRPSFAHFLPKDKTPEISDIVFQIAPKINASGRMRHAMASVDLLTNTGDSDTLHTMIDKVITLNDERKSLERQATKEALLHISDEKIPRLTTVVASENWHKGIVGIMASRLIETHYRPTVVFSQKGDLLIGSARSIPGFNIYDAIASCSQHLERFGGHDHAAGLSLKVSNYKAFRDSFEHYAKEKIKEDKSILSKKIKVNEEVTFDKIDDKFIEILNQFKPFGPQNTTPVFLAKDLKATDVKCVGRDKKTLKMTIHQRGSSKTFSAVGFNMGEQRQISENNAVFSAVFSIGENHWNNLVEIQLVLRDIEALRHHY